ncbi:MAG: hypothetical protein N2Z20_04785 [Elusimicrobiales bacterium]|nr:hypothetical protein [Elusimicrobiales bacterium]
MMDISRKVARLIFPHFRFGESKIDDAIKLVNLGVGGFCLYGGSVDEVIEVIRILRNASDHPLIFAADYENGVGQWVKGATRLPTNMAVAATGDLMFSRRKAEITAIEADALGVDWIFAPVIDIATNHANPIVNLRAFSDEPEIVSSFAREFISGLNSFNIINCIKHFPGHGDTDTDSHMSLPKIKKDIEGLMSLELIPFKILSEISDSVMVGHLLIENIDDSNPASLSDSIVGGILRNKMNYNKIVITDALMMKAIKNETEAGVLAFIAGADLLLYPEDPIRLYHAMIDAINRGLISLEKINTSLRRLDNMISKRRISNYRARDISTIGAIEHKKIILDMSHMCGCVVKDDKIVFGRKIYCFETLSDGKNKSVFFIERLKEIGFQIIDSPSQADSTIIISFSKPKAFSGKINLADKEKEEINNIISNSNKVSFISFGSPFVLDGYLNRVNLAMCFFDDFAEFQRVAAQYIGGITSVKGKMPVKIYE